MTEPMPRWAVEPIVIVDPDPSWPERADELRSELAGLLAPWLITDIHHIGSTAVPGLAAKPVLDLMAGVQELDTAPEIVAVLAGHGWHYVPPERDNLRDHRRFFVQVVDGHRHAHLHLVRPDTDFWRQHLSFRDRLRADEALRTGYAELKRRLAGAHAGDREAYTEAKSEFINRALGDQ